MAPLNRIRRPRGNHSAPLYEAMPWGGSGGGWRATVGRRRRRLRAEVVATAHFPSGERSSAYASPKPRSRGGDVWSTPRRYRPNRSLKRSERPSVERLARPVLSYRDRSVSSVAPGGRPTSPRFSSSRANSTRPSRAIAQSVSELGAERTSRCLLPRSTARSERSAHHPPAVNQTSSPPADQPSPS